MRVFLAYFRAHPWQRRALTGLLAAIVGFGVALLMLPWVEDLQLIAALGSGDADRRTRAVALAAMRARDRPAFLRRLEAALDSPDDARFAAAAEVLERIKRFPPPGRGGDCQDRLWRVKLAAADDPESIAQRLVSVHELVRGGRDNEHARAALALAAGDAEPEVRSAAALLAARLGDDAALGTLLGDKEASVRAAAALDAALAGRTALTSRISQIFQNAQADAEKADAAYALARLAPGEHAGQIAQAVVQAQRDGRDDLLEKLLHVAALPKMYDRAVAGLREQDLKADTTAAAVMQVFRFAGSGDKSPPHMALVAAGKMQLVAARPHVLAAVKAIVDADKSKLTTADAQRLAAAVNAAGRLGAAPPTFAGVMKKLWHPGTSLAMILSAEALAQAGPDPAMTSDQIVALLTQAAGQEGTSLQAAAAAVAIFRHAPDKAAEHLRTACESQAWLVGDYVAWNLARSDDKEAARRLAESFLAADERNEGVASAGAMLLAMLARGTDRAPQVEKALLDRLRAGPLGPLRDPYLAGSYKGALLVLGHGRFADGIIAMVRTTDFPWSRGLTALLLAGKAEGLDLVLGAAAGSAEEIDSVLTGWMMCRVYPAVVEGLPPYDIDAPAAVRYWQCRILRDYYLIHRRAILDRMRP